MVLVLAALACGPASDPDAPAGAGASRNAPAAPDRDPAPIPLAFADMWLFDSETVATSKRRLTPDGRLLDASGTPIPPELFADGRMAYVFPAHDPPRSEFRFLDDGTLLRNGQPVPGVLLDPSARTLRIVKRRQGIPIVLTYALREDGTFANTIAIADHPMPLDSPFRVGGAKTDAQRLTALILATTQSWVTVAPLCQTDADCAPNHECRADAVCHPRAR